MENPYQAPQTTYMQAPVTAQSGQINPGIIRAMRGTKGWVRFLAVVGFIMTGLMFLGGFAVMAIGSNSLFGRIAMAIGLAYLVLGVLNLVVALKLNQYASRISGFLSNPNEMSLITALDSQRGLWKMVGIMAIIVLTLYLLGLLAGQL